VHPGAEGLLRWKTSHVHTGLAEDGEGGHGVDTLDTCEVDPGDAMQFCTEVEVGLILAALGAAACWGFFAARLGVP
jgi:hypothetical protein